MKLMMLAASLRKDSCNIKLIKLAAKLLLEQGAHVDLLDFSVFDVPLYNGDTDAATGLPTGALRFIHHMDKTDGLIISSPEYNFSMPGTLKNLIDWISRGKPEQPWKGRQIYLMSASPALVGGNRGLWNTRIPLESCGAFVYPDMFSLASAYTAFKENGDLNDANLQQRLDTTLQNFINYLQKLKA